MVQDDLKWESLQTRRAHARLGMLYKIVEGLVEVPTSRHPVPHPEHHANCRNSRQFTILDPKVDAYKFAFLPRTVVAWNTLPDNVVLAELVDAFRSCAKGTAHDQSLDHLCVISLQDFT